MSTSPYARDRQHLLAALQTPGDAQEPPRPDEEAGATIHVYPVEGGGILFTKTPLEDEEPAAPIIDSEPPAPAPRKAPPPLLTFVLLLLVFVVLDAANSQLVALLTPTATITLTPEVKTITLHSSTKLGTLLSPITLTESQTVPATGHGHQDAARATGTVTFYNGLFTSQFVAQGTVFTGQDGVGVATTQSATIPPGNPTTGYGTATVTAQAKQAGAGGNIAPGDITITINNGLLVKNTQFTGGKSARDFPVVTQTDLTAAAATLKAKVSASMTAALHGQLLPGQVLQPAPCRPTVTADHAIGDEAATVDVTVAESCTAIAYNSQELTAQATKLFTTQAAKTFGTGYIRDGPISVSVTKATTQQHAVILSFIGQGTWVYQVNAARIRALVSGKPRLAALQLLSHLPGIQQVGISGIPDNQELPTDPTHLHLLIIVTAF